MKKSRTIPAEHLCPIPQCGGRMVFLHSSPNKRGILKHRKCKFCGHEDGALLRIEILEITKVAKRATRNRITQKKVLADTAISRKSAPKAVRNRKAKASK